MIKTRHRMFLRAHSTRGRTQRQRQNRGQLPGSLDGFGLAAGGGMAAVSAVLELSSAMTTQQDTEVEGIEEIKQGYKQLQDG